MNVSNPAIFPNEKYFALKTGLMANVHFLSIFSDLIFGASLSPYIDFKLSNKTGDIIPDSKSIMNYNLKFIFKVPQDLTIWLFGSRFYGITMGAHGSLEKRNISYAKKNYSSDHLFIGFFIRGAYYLR